MVRSRIEMPPIVIHRYYLTHCIILNFVVNIQKIYSRHSHVSLTECDKYKDKYKLLEGKCVRACRSGEYFSKENNRCESCTVMDDNIPNNPDYHLLTNCSFLACPLGTIVVQVPKSRSYKCDPCPNDGIHTLYEGKCVRMCNEYRYFSTKTKQWPCPLNPHDIS